MFTSHFFTVSDVEDTYTNVVLKQLSAIKWVIDSYNSYQGRSKLKWLIKMDEDIIMNPWAMRNYFQYLEKKPENKMSFHCLRLTHKPPYRAPNHKCNGTFNYKMHCITELKKLILKVCLKSCIQ
jgi:hypothetical protein